MILRPVLTFALAATLTACGTTPEKDSNSDANSDPMVEMTPDEEKENNVVDQPDDPEDPGKPMQPEDNPSDEPVEVECVSELVTHSGNYYALTAKISETETLVEMVHYLAATPTSDPVEETIWSASVDAEFTAQLFAFQAEEQFLSVEKSPEDGIYRGTMSGETEFEGSMPTVSCWPTDLEHPARYDADTGGCLDELGEEAHNEIPWMVAVRTGFGQCARFEGELTGEAFGYPTFDFLDLRGADFHDAALHFADLTDSQLEGADLRQFDFGYATVSGTVDEHTQFPELAECEVPEDATIFECTR